VGTWGARSTTRWAMSGVAPDVLWAPLLRPRQGCSRRASA
jgi:hypothetical protein